MLALGALAPRREEGQCARLNEAVTLGRQHSGNAERSDRAS